MTDYICTQCKQPIDDTEPDFRPERAENGRERVFMTVPSLCKACRSKRLWRRIEAIKEGQRD
jgi:DNA-directed RNA polymerase subunit RPC12/RpoP